MPTERPADKKAQRRLMPRERRNALSSTRARKFSKPAQLRKPQISWKTDPYPAAAKGSRPAARTKRKRGIRESQ